MNVKSIKSSVLAVMSAAAGVIVSTTAFAAERPELLAYPFKTSVTEGGTYANGSAVGTDFVISGTISSALTFSSDVPYRVTLDGATVSKTITLSGDATLWLVGDNVIETTAATAVSSTGTLTIGGPGSVTLASAPTKKQTGPVVAENLVVAGGNVSIVLNADVKNVAGITLTGDYVQLAGTVDIDCASGWDWARMISLPSRSGCGNFSPASRRRFAGQTSRRILPMPRTRSALATRS